MINREIKYSFGWKKKKASYLSYDVFCGLNMNIYIACEYKVINKTIGSK